MNHGVDHGPVAHAQALAHLGHAGTGSCSWTPCRPATAMSMSPSAMPCVASMTALRPEPQTLLIVSAPTPLLRPPFKRGLARRRLAGARADDVAEDALVDGRRVDARALDGFAHGHRAELGGLEILESAQELAGGRANGADDHGLTHGGSSFDHDLLHDVGSDEFLQAGGQHRAAHGAVRAATHRCARARPARRRATPARCPWRARAGRHPPRKRDLRRRGRLAVEQRRAAHGLRWCEVIPYRSGGRPHAERPIITPRGRHSRTTDMIAGSCDWSWRRRRRAAASCSRRRASRSTSIRWRPTKRRLPGRAAGGVRGAVARDKVHAGRLRHPAAVVLGADTVVVVDEMMLGKPVHDDEAVAMLRRLSGRVARRADRRRGRVAGPGTASPSNARRCGLPR